ncbi:hypothetical protein TNCT_604211 [Trichonephila clavata]|uniref:Uncharacterized protein n=1 Tax=Trichonephila clavata TaxID=2740835 RepID=A0A8X6IK72_TRICU|nr:hypothetical protein TNCT_604211 [Trichonephila clavata]
MRQRPLPVLLEKFRSPKPLVLATTRRRLHHSLFPSTATRSSCDFPTSLTRTLHQLPPAAGLPSPGPARDGALFRCCSKNFEVQNHSTSCSLLHHLQLHFTLRLQLDRLPYETRTNCAQTPPDGWASVPLGRMRQRPLPVDLEKFRSPKTLHFPFSSSYHSLFPSTATRSSCDFPTSLTRNLHKLPRRQGSRTPRPHATAPSSGAARKISKSKNTPPRHHSMSSSLDLPFNCNSILSQLAHEPRTHSPGGRAPVTGARIPQRPLPVDLEKFRSPKPLHFLFSSSSLATSLHPSTATRSSSLRDSHELCTNSPDGWASVPLGRMRQRPLPVDLEKFRSPKHSLVLDSLPALFLRAQRICTLPRRTPYRMRQRLFGCSNSSPPPRHHSSSDLPSLQLDPLALAHEPRTTPPRQGSRHRARIHNALFRWTSKNFEVQNHFLFSSSLALHFTFDCTRSSSLRDSHELCTTPPTAGLPYPRPHATAPSSGGPRKISKSKPLVLTTSCSVRAKSRLGDRFTPSLSPLPCTTRLHLSRRQGSRHQGPHETAPSSGAARKISKSKTAPSRLFPFITRSSTRASHPLLPTAGLPSPGPQPTTPSSGGPSPGPLHFTLASNSDFFFFFPLLQATLQCF